jgi:transcriptional regulator with XRE-family HTH domain
MAKRGRKPFKPDLQRVERLAAQGLSQKQICISLGISEDTLYKYKKINAEFAEALSRGQTQGLQDVSNALYQNALDGNFNAQKLYLAVRDPERWREQTDIHHSGGMEQTITIVDPGCGAVGTDADPIDDQS